MSASPIEPTAVANLESHTPMMQQYLGIKANHADALLFYRMGDFYELFHEDAEVGSEVMGLALTSRDKNAENPIPMAGFPWHQLEDNLRKMLRAGHKVTVAEQEQELREGAKLLERVVTRVYTPGSLYEESLIGTDSSALLCALSVAADSVAASKEATAVSISAKPSAKAASTVSPIFACNALTVPANEVRSD